MSGESYAPQYRTLIKDAAVVQEFDNLAAQLKRTAPRQYVQHQPTDPTGTADLTGKMMGLPSGSGFVTLKGSGTMMVSISGNLTNSTAAAGNGAKAHIRIGTGSAPSNGSALTGAKVGSDVSAVLAAASSDPIPFHVHAIVPNLTLGTYWVDLGLAALVAGTGVAKNLSVSAVEL